MLATNSSFDLRYVGIIKTVSTTPPSVTIMPQQGGPLVTATDFTPAQLSTILMQLSIDMRQVTYIMKPHRDGWRAHEVMCVGKVPSVDKEEPGDIWLRSMWVNGKKAKSGRHKGNANANDSKLIRPPAHDIAEEWSQDGYTHEVLQSKPDPIMGHFMRQAISRSERMVSKEVLQKAGMDMASMYPASGVSSQQDSETLYVMNP